MTHHTIIAAIIVSLVVIAFSIWAYLEWKRASAKAKQKREAFKRPVPTNTSKMYPPRGNGHDWSDNHISTGPKPLPTNSFSRTNSSPSTTPSNPRVTRTYDDTPVVQDVMTTHLLFGSGSGSSDYNQAPSSSHSSSHSCSRNSDSDSWSSSSSSSSCDSGSDSSSSSSY